MTAKPVPKVRSLECPNCGGTVEVRGHAHTINAVCVQCLSILDTTTPSLQIIQKFKNKERYQPLVPLGKRGRFWGTEYEVIGFQVRQITVEGSDYRWAEYLLYNPFKGYMYLSEYLGHWNAIRTLRALPLVTGKTVTFGGRAYKHFQSANATTIYVMGEFPWQVRVGEHVQVNDYVAPPYVLSTEETAGEIVWSSGTYMAGAEIWKALTLPGSPPSPQGIYANQPSPYTGSIWGVWRTFAVLVLIFLAVVIGILVAGDGQEVFRQKYVFSTTATGEHAFVTPVFELKGRKSQVKVNINTDLDNDWAGFSIALINEDTGVAYNVSEQVSYYHGTDSDGSWTEGGRNDNANFPGVPPGRYYLRVEPDMDDDGQPHLMNYELVVTYGSIGIGWLILVFFLLPIPAIIGSLRRASFETRRWAESDYG